MMILMYELALFYSRLSCAGLGQVRSTIILIAEPSPVRSPLFSLGVFVRTPQAQFS